MTSSRTRTTAVLRTFFHSAVISGVLGLFVAVQPLDAAQWAGFAAAETYATAGSDPRDVHVADVDGDGILDLAAFHGTERKVSVLLGNGTAGVGDGTFQAPIELPTNVGMTGIAFGHFDGDGVLDLAVAGNDGPVFVFQGVGDGTFSTPVPYPSGGGLPGRIQAVDLDGDEILDLVLTHVLDSTVSALLGNGSGGVGDGTFGTPATVATDTLPRDVEVGDFDGDLIPDLATVNSDGDSVSVLLGNGDGTFGGRIDYPIGGRSLDLEVADLDGDSILDLVFTEIDSHVVKVLRGNGSGGVGDGTFSGPVASPASFHQWNAVTGDFDGDTVPDVATATFTSRRASVFLGAGDGSFGSQRVYPADRELDVTQPTSIATGDFDGDGWLDLATANQSSDDMSVFLNVGEAAVEGAILISELMADPDQVADAAGQYVEIYNNTSRALHLDQWELADSSGGTRHLGGVVEPGQHFVIGASGDLDGAGFAPDFVPFAWPLFDQGGDSAVLSDSSGTVYARVDFASGNAFGPGVSYELVNLHAAVAGVSQEAHYRASATPFGADLGSPGATGVTSSDATATVTPSAGPNGSIAPDTPQTLAILGTGSFTLAPDPGFVVTSAGGTCGGSLAGDVFTTDPVVEGCTVEAGFAAVTSTTLLVPALPLRVGVSATFAAEISSAAGAPTDGQVELTASTGESCIDATPTVGPVATFSCDLTFAATGARIVTATFSGSTGHAGSSSPAEAVTVQRFADLSVTADDGQHVWMEGVPAVYLIRLRNAGPDEAPNTRLLTATLPELDDAEWECVAVGGAVCPAASGTGEVDLTATLPVAGGLDVVYGGLVPAGWEDSVALGAEAIPETGAPGDVFDFDPANNLAIDVDLPVGIFFDGFESGDTSAWSATAP